MAADELIQLWSRSGTEPRTNFEILRRIGDGYVSLSPSGTPALIVPLPEGDVHGRGRVLGSVRLRYESALRFDVEDETWTQAAAVVDCMEPKLVRTFCVVVRDILERLRSTGASAKQVAAALSAWDELLRRKGALDDASELGLWGELYIISMSPSPAAMVDAWRGPHGDAFDYMGGGVALECKTSTRRHRHHVSQRQASIEGDAISAFIVSVWAVEDASAGKGLVDLIDEIMADIPDESAFLHKLLLAGYQEDHRHEYGRRFACPSTPTFFHMKNVPRIREFDDRISNIRYDVDLSGVPTLSKREVEDVFSALTGKKQ